jgi:2-succinyl-5-enolpyruvyl-6-hydroxy-3-cyclohexene-1-carboxylate synthase
LQQSLEYSDKQSVVDLVHLCALYGIRYAVISPGSRNAPISITFHRHPDIETIVVPDERVAGFVAMGIAQQTGIPVVLCCTSGSAALNYAPALAEAYYQRIPLLVVSADRPVEMVDQGDGQTIRQKDVYRNYIRKSIELQQDAVNKSSIQENRNKIENALHACLQPIGGPVHINFPLSEPLYNTSKYTAGQMPVKSAQKTISTESFDFAELAQSFNKNKRVLVICGMIAPDKKLNDLLGQLAEFQQVAILTESTSNLSHPLFLPCIDRLIFTFDEADLEQFKPDLLITIGVQIISKKIKAVIRNNSPKEHWHLDTELVHPDTFQCLSKSIHANPAIVLSSLLPLLQKKDSYYSNWMRERDKAIDKQHQLFMESCEFSDHKAVELLLNAIPAQTNFHLGNSASVRYVQLFKQGRTQSCNANRGTSGIDGCTSTAIGAAMAHGKPTVLLTGDMAFLYDSNAFWQKSLPANLKIVVLNNGGGGIFRIIEGPSDAQELEKYFEAHHSMTAQKVAEMYDLPYSAAHNEQELADKLTTFFTHKTQGPAILEIFTPRLKNAPVLKAYFKQLQLAKIAVN